MQQDKIVHQCPGCGNNIVRKLCEVGERLCDDQYHYDLEWLVQCDLCKTVYTVYMTGDCVVKR